MNKSKVWIAVLVSAVLAGCTAYRPMKVHETIAPLHRGYNLPPAEGSLVVYSATEIPDVVGSRHPTHSGYKILQPDGSDVKWVDNRSGPFYSDPATVLLPPGKYIVKARARNLGWLFIPVVIAADQLTVVDLQGSVLPQTPAPDGRSWVRLPNGTLIGPEAK